ncbi:hypothetical protein AvCA_28680 [Azotobacter vinelandii CA]|uniref:Uncharacterized protein n=2 Tax=Azotobacter vinelandii TaxID=354 RepID=C1DLV3_AZOVD|nr:hypothetical protein Avin_28680 [Azotobacter vinelandii DJ]AGK14830.1 hypothetical protein AvCA_28680 [Azotobacter vinelandii CA]AGK20916.1 hypothetical protein AvCA6_28680 [Azotobacter vinelandii CA6]
MQAASAGHCQEMAIPGFTVPGKARSLFE